MSIGIFRGIGGFILRPLRGGIEFITQPLVGIIYTPHCIYRKLTEPRAKDAFKEINFKIFGIEQYQFERARLRPATDDFSDEASILIKPSNGEVSIFIDDDDDDFDEQTSLLSRHKSQSTPPKKLRRRKNAAKKSRKMSSSHVSFKDLSNDMQNFGDQDNQEPQYPAEINDFNDFASSSESRNMGSLLQQERKSADISSRPHFNTPSLGNLQRQKGRYSVKQ